MAADLTATSTHSDAHDLAALDPLRVFEIGDCDLTPRVDLLDCLRELPLHTMNLPAKVASLPPLQQRIHHLWPQVRLNPR